jgi:hypothetical protein
MLQLQEFLGTFAYDIHADDSWTLIWRSQVYSSKCYYQSVFPFLPASPIFKAIWKSKCTPRQ